MINGEQLIKFLKFVRMFADSTSEHADIINSYAFQSSRRCTREKELAYLQSLIL